MISEQTSFKLYFLFFIFQLIFSFSISAGAQTQENRIDFPRVLTEIPKTSFEALQLGFSKESIPWWVDILGASVVLINNDEEILKEIRQSGRSLGIGNEDKTKAALTSGQIDVIRLPTDIGSFMYFLGDGWMHFGIAGGFVFNGLSNDSNRSYNTGLRIMHSMAVSTLFNQLLKRSFGRESPYVRTEPGGRWRPFPSLAEYQEYTSSYDAMPSGHIMTATSTFIIIRDSYPEYSDYIVPLGVTWISLLGYQMVNNSVHWISDYPLGIGMGYVFAKSAMTLGKQPKKITDPNKTTWTIIPSTNYEGSRMTFLMQF